MFLTQQLQSIFFQFNFYRYVRYFIFNHEHNPFMHVYIIMIDLIFLSSNSSNELMY